MDIFPSEIILLIFSSKHIILSKGFLEIFKKYIVLKNIFSKIKYFKIKEIKNSILFNGKIILMPNDGWTYKKIINYGNFLCLDSLLYQYIDHRNELEYICFNDKFIDYFIFNGRLHILTHKYILLYRNNKFEKIINIKKLQGIENYCFEMNNKIYFLRIYSNGHSKIITDDNKEIFLSNEKILSCISINSYFFVLYEKYFKIYNKNIEQIKQINIETNLSNCKCIDINFGLIVHELTIYLTDKKIKLKFLI